VAGFAQNGLKTGWLVMTFISFLFRESPSQKPGKHDVPLQRVQTGQEGRLINE